MTDDSLDHFHFERPFPDIPECIINLIDALYDYRALLQSIADGSFDDRPPIPAGGQIYDEITACTRMIESLENEWGLDPTLHGLIQS